jgi:hypothetical protein
LQEKLKNTQASNQQITTLQEKDRVAAQERTLTLEEQVAEAHQSVQSAMDAKTAKGLQLVGNQNDEEMAQQNIYLEESNRHTNTWSGIDEENFPNEGENQDDDSPSLVTFPNKNPTIPEIGEDTIIPEIVENTIIPARGEEQQTDHQNKIILLVRGRTIIHLTDIFTELTALGYYHILYHILLLTGSTLVSPHR